MSNRLKELVQSGQASELDFERLGIDQVRTFKSDRESVQLRCCTHEVKAVGDAERTLRFVFSDESVDSYGDILKQDGWDLTRYKKNPVILWAHDGTTNPPIGRAPNVRVEGTQLVGDIEFAPKGAFEFAETLYQLSLGGFLRGNSVGFQPKEVAELSSKEAEELGLGKYGVLFTKQALLENSLVSVGANENALQDGLRSLVQRGLVTDKTSRNFAKTYPLTEMDWRKVLREKVRSFVDFGANKGGEAVYPIGQTHGLEPKAYEANFPRRRFSNHENQNIAFAGIDTQLDPTKAIEDPRIDEHIKHLQAQRAWMEAVETRLAGISTVLDGLLSPDQIDEHEQRDNGQALSAIVSGDFDSSGALARIEKATAKGN